MFDMEKFTRLSSFKVKVKPWTKMHISTSTLILKDEVNSTINPHIQGSNQILFLGIDFDAHQLVM